MTITNSLYIETHNDKNSIPLLNSMKVFETNRTISFFHLQENKPITTTVIFLCLSDSLSRKLFEDLTMDPGNGK